MEGVDVPPKAKLTSIPSVKLQNEANVIKTNREDSSYSNLYIPDKQTTKEKDNSREESDIEGFTKILNSLKNSRSNIDFYNNDTGSNLNQHFNLYSSQLFNDFINSTEGTNGNEDNLNQQNTNKNKVKNIDLNINVGIENNSFDSIASKCNPYYEGTFNKKELSNTLKSSKMSEGPPHHSHGRQAPSPNTAWNHLQVPNYFPRQPQHAHMSNEHPILHQPTWHTPTTEPVKSMPHSHLFNLEQMISDRSFPKHSPGVDLTLQRNGSQNGELPTTPISLSVRDANKINSLAASAIDVQGSEIKSLSPGLKSHSPGLKGTTPSLLLKSISPGLLEKNVKRPTKKMEQILERLNPTVDKSEKVESILEKNAKLEQEKLEKSGQSSVIVQSTSMHDENSNSNSVLSTTVLSNSREEDVVSPFSNEDSMDSNKSRRKRKPSKTMRVSKDTIVENESEEILKEIQEFEKTANATTERRRSGSAPPGSPSSPPRQRRKASSESETIDNIAAMIQSTECNKDVEEAVIDSNKKVSVIIKKDNVELSKGDKEKSAGPVFQTPAQKKITDPNSFVEVENKLEEMFAGISDDFIEPTKLEYNSKVLSLDDSKNGDEKANHVDNSVTSTLSDVTQENKRKRTKSAKGQSFNDSNSEIYTKKKKSNKKWKSTENSPTKNKPNSKKNKNAAKQLITKTDLIKDIYSYDSGSNASSSRSKGPFIQIKGSRDSPISVNIINTPMNEDDSDKKVNKSKKYHDDTEYRHKVRSRGLHCSTLSNKYDAQTRDASWICVFCKRGPHATEPHLLGPSRFNATIIIPAPGDLFGPYIITTDSPEYQRRLDDPYDQQFKSKKVARAVIASKPVNKKVKRKHSDSYDSRSSLEGNDGVDVYLGITETRDKVYEVWAHEDCIVWSPGVYLVGPKIIGLEEAVWTSCNVICNKCRYKGANVCCVKRGCTNVVHVGCAAASEWFLDEDNYKAFCMTHKKQ